MVCQFQQIMTRTFKFESENPWMAISRPSQSLKTNNFLHKSYISKCTCNLAISSENCNLFKIFCAHQTLNAALVSRPNVAFIRSRPPQMSSELPTLDLFEIELCSLQIVDIKELSI